MNFELRKLTLSDAQSLAKAANNENVARFLREKFPYPYTLQDAVEYINYVLSSKNELTYGIFVENQVCGCISVIFRGDVYKKSCELGYWLSEEHWGKGIMTSAVKEFCTFVFENYDINRIDAEIFADNISSRRVLEKVGFSFEGLHKEKVYKYGKFMDEAVYALVKK